MKTRFLLVVAGVILSGFLAAQVSPPPFRLSEYLMESLSASGQESSDYETLLTELEVLQKNPVNINRATREDLQKIFFLTPFQINSLLEYRDSHGPLISIYELQVVYGYTDEVISMMLPFVVVAPVDDKKPLDMRTQLKKTHNEFELRIQRVLEKSKGYSNYDSASRAYTYPGSPWFMNIKYAFEAGDKIHAGVTLEKDAGEDFFRASNSNGFDFQSAYLQLSEMGPVREAIIGDYRLCFGQGLTLWNVSAPGKSALPLNIGKRQDAAKPYTANDENRFFRGSAITFHKRDAEITVFYSSKKRDANIVDTSVDGMTHFSSFQQSGYHRTPSEISDEKSVRERVAGGNVNFRRDPVKVGLTVVSYSFNKFMDRGDALKDVYDFSGDHLWNAGVDYACNLKNFQFFGEISHSAGHWGHVHGALFKANKYASLSALYRSFQPGFFSMNGAAFSEGSQNTNEQGFYLGFEIHAIRKISVTGYADFYRFPWPKFRVSAPSGGNDFLIQLAWKPGKKTEMLLKLHTEENPLDEDADSVLSPVVGSMHKTSFRWHFEYPVTGQIQMQSRVEYTNSGHDNTHSRGYMVYQDAEYRLRAIPLSIFFRLAWFHTDDYDTRIYAYEHDMVTGFSFPPLYDKGFRGYIMATAKIGQQLTCSVRFSGTWYTGMHEIGSGYDLIDAPARTDIKMRIAYRF